MSAYRPAENSSLAIVSLIFGLLAWLLIPLIGAVVAVITGHMARAEIRRSPSTIEGDGLAIAGLVLGYLQFGLIAATLMLLLLAIIGLPVLVSILGN